MYDILWLNVTKITLHFAVSSVAGASAVSVEKIAASEVKTEVKQEVKQEETSVDPELLKEAEKQILFTLDDATIELPIDSEELLRLVLKNSSIHGLNLSIVDDLVQKCSALMLLV